MKNEYMRLKRIVDGYFRLFRRLMTGEGNVPEHVLKKLHLKGKRIEGLLPKMARYGASLHPEGVPRIRDLQEQIEAAQIRVELAMDNLKTKTMQTAHSALSGAAAAAVGSALFVMAAEALRNRRAEFTADWSRAVKTEMHNAREGGACTAVLAFPDGDDTRVFKRCQPDACARCRQVYQNPDGTPKIFTLGELRRNGTNVGRRAADWLPVIGCLHPHCQCTLEVAKEEA